MPHLNHKWGKFCPSWGVYGASCGIVTENWYRRLWRRWRGAIESSAIAQYSMPNDQCSMPNAQKIDWRFWGFGSHGLVAMIW